MRFLKQRYVLFFKEELQLLAENIEGNQENILMTTEHAIAFERGALLSQKIVQKANPVARADSKVRSDFSVWMMGLLFLDHQGRVSQYVPGGGMESMLRSIEAKYENTYLRQWYKASQQKSVVFLLPSHTGNPNLIQVKRILKSIKDLRANLPEDMEVLIGTVRKNGDLHVLRSLDRELDDETYNRSLSDLYGAQELHHLFVGQAIHEAVNSDGWRSPKKNDDVLLDAINKGYKTIYGRDLSPAARTELIAHFQVDLEHLRNLSANSEKFIGTVNRLLISMSLFVGEKIVGNATDLSRLFEVVLVPGVHEQSKPMVQEEPISKEHLRDVRTRAMAGLGIANTSSLSHNPADTSVYNYFLDTTGYDSPVFMNLVVNDPRVMHVWQPIKDPKNNGREAVRKQSRFRTRFDNAYLMNALRTNKEYIHLSEWLGNLDFDEEVENPETFRVEVVKRLEQAKSILLATDSNGSNFKNQVVAMQGKHGATIYEQVKKYAQHVRSQQILISSWGREARERLIEKSNIDKVTDDQAEIVIPYAELDNIFRSLLNRTKKDWPKSAAYIDIYLTQSAENGETAEIDLKDTLAILDEVMVEARAVYNYSIPLDISSHAFSEIYFTAMDEILFTEIEGHLERLKKVKTTEDPNFTSAIEPMLVLTDLVIANLAIEYVDQEASPADPNTPIAARPMWAVGALFLDENQKPLRFKTGAGAQISIESPAVSFSLPQLHQSYDSERHQSIVLSYATYDAVPNIKQIVQFFHDWRKIQESFEGKPQVWFSSVDHSGDIRVYRPKTVNSQAEETYEALGQALQGADIVDKFMRKLSTKIYSIPDSYEKKIVEWRQMTAKNYVKFVEESLATVTAPEFAEPIIESFKSYFENEIARLKKAKSEQDILDQTVNLLVRTHAFIGESLTRGLSGFMDVYFEEVKIENLTAQALEEKDEFREAVEKQFQTMLQRAQHHRDQSTQLALTHIDGKAADDEELTSFIRPWLTEFLEREWRNQRDPKRRENPNYQKMKTAWEAKQLLSQTLQRIRTANYSSFSDIKRIYHESDSLESSLTESEWKILSAELDGMISKFLEEYAKVIDQRMDKVLAELDGEVSAFESLRTQIDLVADFIESTKRLPTGKAKESFAGNLGFMQNVEEVVGRLNDIYAALEIEVLEWSDLLKQAEQILSQIEVAMNLLPAGDRTAVIAGQLRGAKEEVASRLLAATVNEIHSRLDHFQESGDLTPKNELSNIKYFEQKTRTLLATQKDLALDYENALKGVAKRGDELVAVAMAFRQLVQLRKERNTDLQMIRTQVDAAAKSAEALSDSRDDSWKTRLIEARDQLLAAYFLPVSEEEVSSAPQMYLSEQLEAARKASRDARRINEELGRYLNDLANLIRSNPAFESERHAVEQWRKRMESHQRYQRVQEDIVLLGKGLELRQGIGRDVLNLMNQSRDILLGLDAFEDTQLLDDLQNARRALALKLAEKIKEEASVPRGVRNDAIQSLEIILGGEEDEEVEAAILVLNPRHLIATQRAQARRATEDQKIADLKASITSSMNASEKLAVVVQILDLRPNEADASRWKASLEMERDIESFRERTKNSDLSEVIFNREFESLVLRLNEQEESVQRHWLPTVIEIAIEKLESDIALDNLVDGQHHVQRMEVIVKALRDKAELLGPEAKRLETKTIQTRRAATDRFAARQSQESKAKELFWELLMQDVNEKNILGMQTALADMKVDDREVLVYRKIIELRKMYESDASALDSDVVGENLIEKRFSAIELLLKGANDEQTKYLVRFRNQTSNALRNEVTQFLKSKKDEDIAPSMLLTFQGVEISLQNAVEQLAVLYEPTRQGVTDDEGVTVLHYDVKDLIRYNWIVGKILAGSEWGDKTAGVSYLEAARRFALNHMDPRISRADFMILQREFGNDDDSIQLARMIGSDISEIESTFNSTQRAKQLGLLRTRLEETKLIGERDHLNYRIRDLERISRQARKDTENTFWQTLHADPLSDKIETAQLLLTQMDVSNEEKPFYEDMLELRKLYENKESKFRSQFEGENFLTHSLQAISFLKEKYSEANQARQLERFKKSMTRSLKVFVQRILEALRVDRASVTDADRNMIAMIADIHQILQADVLLKMSTRQNLEEEYIENTLETFWFLGELLATEEFNKDLLKAIANYEAAYRITVERLRDVQSQDEVLALQKRFGIVGDQVQLPQMIEDRIIALEDALDGQLINAHVADLRQRREAANDEAIYQKHLDQRLEALGAIYLGIRLENEKIHAKREPEKALDYAFFYLEEVRRLKEEKAEAEAEGTEWVEHSIWNVDQLLEVATNMLAELDYQLGEIDKKEEGLTSVSIEAEKLPAVATEMKMLMAHLFLEQLVDLEALDFLMEGLDSLVKIESAEERERIANMGLVALEALKELIEEIQPKDSSGYEQLKQTDRISVAHYYLVASQLYHYAGGNFADVWRFQESVRFLADMNHVEDVPVLASELQGDGEAKSEYSKKKAEVEKAKELNRRLVDWRGRLEGVKTEYLTELAKELEETQDLDRKKQIVEEIQSYDKEHPSLKKYSDAYRRAMEITHALTREHEAVWETLELSANSIDAALKVLESGEQSLEDIMVGYEVVGREVDLPAFEELKSVYQILAQSLDEVIFSYLDDIIPQRDSENPEYYEVDDLHQEEIDLLKQILERSKNALRFFPEKIEKLTKWQAVLNEAQTRLESGKLKGGAYLASHEVLELTHRQTGEKIELRFLNIHDRGIDFEIRRPSTWAIFQGKSAHYLAGSGRWISSLTEIHQKQTEHKNFPPSGFRISTGRVRNKGSLYARFGLHQVGEGLTKTINRHATQFSKSEQQGSKEAAQKHFFEELLLSFQVVKETDEGVVLHMGGTQALEYSVRIVKEAAADAQSDKEKEPDQTPLKQSKLGEAGVLIYEGGLAAASSSYQQELLSVMGEIGVQRLGHQLGDFDKEGPEVFISVISGDISDRSLHQKQMNYAKLKFPEARVFEWRVLDNEFAEILSVEDAEDIESRKEVVVRGREIKAAIVAEFVARRSFEGLNEKENPLTEGGARLIQLPEPEQAIKKLDPMTRRKWKDKGLAMMAKTLAYLQTERDEEEEEAKTSAVRFGVEAEAAIESVRFNDKKKTTREPGFFEFNKASQIREDGYLLHFEELKSSGDVPQWQEDDAVQIQFEEDGQIYEATVISTVAILGDNRVVVAIDRDGLDLDHLPKSIKGSIKRIEKEKPASVRFEAQGDQRVLVIENIRDSKEAESILVPGQNVEIQFQGQVALRATVLSNDTEKAVFKISNVFQPEDLSLLQQGKIRKVEEKNEAEAHVFIDRMQGRPVLVFQNLENQGSRALRLKEEDRVDIVFDARPEHVYKAMVLETDDGSIITTLPRDFDRRDLARHQHGMIRKEFNPVTHDVQIEAVRQVIEDPESISRAARVGAGLRPISQKPQDQHVRWIVLANPMLRKDHEQLLLLERALNGDTLELGWGPIGTGKSTTGAEILIQKQILDTQKGTAQLVTAQTNAAIDRVLLLLKNQGVKVYRVASRESMFDPRLIDNWIYADRPEDPSRLNPRASVEEMEVYHRTRRDWENHITAELTSGRAVIGGSIVSLANDRFLGRLRQQGLLRFTNGFLEESGVATIGQTMAVLSMVDGDLMAIGDHKQLGVGMISEDVEKKLASKGFSKDDIELMRTSLFEIFLNEGIFNITMLKRVYRLTPLLVQLANFHYEGKLIAARDDYTEAENKSSLIVIDTADFGHPGEKRGTSAFNRGEAEASLAFYEWLTKNLGIGGDHLGFIVPYGAQLRHIRYKIQELIKKQNLSPDQERALFKRLGKMVGTVWPFQGDERPFIISSSVQDGAPKRNRSGDLSVSTGYVGTDMMNVMNTRSQEGLIVFINSRTFLASNDLRVRAFTRLLIDLAQINDSYFEVNAENPASFLKNLEQYLPTWRTALAKRHEAESLPIFKATEITTPEDEAADDSMLKSELRSIEELPQPKRSELRLVEGFESAENALHDRNELRVTQQELEQAVMEFYKKFESSRFSKMLDAGLIVPAQQIEENGKVLSGGAMLLVPVEALKENVHQLFFYTELINYLKEDMKIPAEQIEFVASQFLPSKFIIPHLFQDQSTLVLSSNYFMLKVKNVETTGGKKETFYINPYPYFYKSFLRDKPVRSVSEAELPNTLRNGFTVLPFVGETTDFFKWVHYDEAKNKLIITLEKPDDVNALPVGMVAINTNRESVYQNLHYGDKAFGIYLGVHPKEEKTTELVVEIARQSISAKGLAVEGAWRHSLHVPADQKSVRSMQRLLRGQRAKGFFGTLKRYSEQKRLPEGFYYFDRMEKFDDDIKNQELVREGEELLYHLVNNFLSSLLNPTPTQIMHVLSGRERKHVEEIAFELSEAKPIEQIPYWVEDKNLKAEPMYPGQKYLKVSDFTSHWDSGRAKDKRFQESELNRPLLAERPYSQRADYRVEFSPHVSGEKSRVFILTQQRDPFAAKPRHPHRVLASILKMDLEQEQIEILFTLPTDADGHALVSIARKKADGSFEKFQMNEKTKSVYLRSGRNEKLYIIDERPKGNIIELSDMDFNDYGNISYRMQSRWLAGAQASGIVASMLAEDTIQKQYDELVKTLEASALAPWKEEILEAMEGTHESLDGLNAVIKEIAKTIKFEDSEINLLTGMAFSVSRKHALHQLVYEKGSAKDHPIVGLLHDIDRHDQPGNPLSTQQVESREKIRRLNLAFLKEKPALYGVSSQALAVLYAARKSLYHIPSVDRKIEALINLFQEWKDPLVEELNYLLEAAHSKDLIHQIEAVRFMLNSDFVPADVAFFEVISRVLTIGRFEKTEEKRSELRTPEESDRAKAQIEVWRAQISSLVELGILPKPGEGDVISFLNGAEANLFEFVTGVGTEARADMKLEAQLGGITTIFNDLGVDFQEAQVRKNYKGTIISSFEDVDGFMAELRKRKDLNPKAVVLKFSEDYFVEYKTHDLTRHLYDLYEAGEITDEKFSEDFNRFKREAGLEYIRLLNRYLEAIHKEYGPVSVLVIEDSPTAYSYLEFPQPTSLTANHFKDQKRDDVLPLFLDHGYSYDQQLKKMRNRDRLKIKAALELGLGGHFEAYYLGPDFEAHVLELLRQQTVKHFSDDDQKAAIEVALDEAYRLIRRMNPTAPFKERINFIVSAVRTLGIDKPINQFYTQSIGWLSGLITAAGVAAEFGLVSMAVTYYLNLKNFGELISYSSAFYIVALSAFSFFATLMSAFYVPSILYRAQTNFKGVDLFFPNALFHLAHRHPRALGILAHEWVHFVSAEFNGNSPSAIVRNDVITSAVQVLVEKEIRDELGTQDVEGELEDLRLKSWIHLLDLFWTGGREKTRERNIQKGYQTMRDDLKLKGQAASDHERLKSFRKIVRESKSHWDDFRGFQVLQMVLRIFFTLGFYSPENYALSYRIGGMALALSEDDPTNDRAWEFLRRIGLGQSVAESYVNLFEKSLSLKALHFIKRKPLSSDPYSQNRSELRHKIGEVHNFIERYTGVIALSFMTVLFWQSILSFVTAYYLSLIIATGILGLARFILGSFRRALLVDYDERFDAVNEKVKGFKQELKVIDTAKDIKKLRDRTYQAYQTEFPLKKAEAQEQVRNLFDLLGSLSGSGLTAKMRSEAMAEGFESILGVRLLMAQRDAMRRKGFSEAEIEKLHVKTFPRYSFVDRLTRFPGQLLWFFFSAPFRILNYFLEQAQSKGKEIQSDRKVEKQSKPVKAAAEAPLAVNDKPVASLEVTPIRQPVHIAVREVEKPKLKPLSSAEEKSEDFMQNVFRRKILLLTSPSEKAQSSFAAEKVLNTFEEEMKREQALYESSMSQKIKAAFKTLVSQHPEVNVFRLKLQDRVNELKSQEKAREFLPLELEQIRLRINEALASGSMQSSDVATDKRVASFRQSVEQSRLPDSERSTWISKLEGLVNEVGRAALAKEQLEYQRRVDRRLEVLKTSLTERIQGLSITVEEILSHSMILEAREAIKNPLLTEDLQQTYQQMLDKLVESLVAALEEKPRENTREKLKALVLRAGEELLARITNDNITAEEIRTYPAILEYNAMMSADGEAVILSDEERASFQRKMAELMDSLKIAREHVLHQREVDLLTNAYTELDSHLTQKVEVIHLGGKLIEKDQRVIDFYAVLDEQEMLSSDERKNWKNKLENRVNDLEKRSYEILENEGQVWKTIATNANFLQVGVQARMKGDLEYAEKYFTVLSELDFIAALTVNEDVAAYVKPEYEAELRHRLRVATDAVFHLADIYFEAGELSRAIDVIDSQKFLISQYFPDLKAGDPLYQLTRQLEMISNAHESKEALPVAIKTSAELAYEKAVARNIKRLEKAQGTQVELDFVAWFERIQTEVIEQLRALEKFTIEDINRIAESADIQKFTQYLIFYAEPEVQEEYMTKLEELLKTEAQPFRNKWREHLEKLERIEQEKLAELVREEQERLQESARKEQEKLFKEYVKSYELFIDGIEDQHVLYREGSRFMDDKTVEEFKEKINKSHLNDENKKYFLDLLEKALADLLKKWLSEEVQTLLRKIESQMELFRSPEQLMDAVQGFRERVIASRLSEEIQKNILEDLDKQLESFARQLWQEMYVSAQAELNSDYALRGQIQPILSKADGYLKNALLKSRSDKEGAVQQAQEQYGAALLRLQNSTIHQIPEFAKRFLLVRTYVGLSKSLRYSRFEKNGVERAMAYIDEALAKIDPWSDDLLEEKAAILVFKAQNLNSGRQQNLAQAEENFLTAQVILESLALRRPMSRSIHGMLIEVYLGLSDDESLLRLIQKIRESNILDLDRQRGAEKIKEVEKMQVLAQEGSVIKLKAKDVVSRQPKMKVYAYPNIFRAVLEIPSEKLLFLVDTETGNFVKLGGESYVRLYRSFLIYKDRLAVEYADRSIALLNVTTGKEIALQKPKAVESFTQHSDVQVSEYLFKDSDIVTNQSGDLWVQYTSNASGEFVVLRYNAKNGTAAQEDVTKEALRRRRAMDAPYIRAENFPWLYFFEKQYFVAKGKRSELRLAPEASLSKATYFETYQADILATGEAVTNRIYSLVYDGRLRDLLQVKYAFAAEPVNLDLSSQEEALIVSNYRKLFSNQAQIVVPAQILQSLSNEGRQKFFDLLIRGIGNTDVNLLPMIYFAGEEADALKKEFYTYSFFRDNAAINRVLKVQLQPEITIANRLKHKTVSVSVAKATTEALEAEIPGLFVEKQDMLKIKNESDRVRLLTNLVQLQLLAATEIKDQLASGQERTKLFGSLLKKIGMEYSITSEGFIQPSLPSLVSGVLAQYLDSQRAISTAA
jgi:predicted DNA-binding ribbon-helix-helix protein